jgi:hypothetical protein
VNWIRQNCTLGPSPSDRWVTPQGSSGIHALSTSLQPFKTQAYFVQCAFSLLAHATAAKRMSLWNVPFWADVASRDWMNRFLTFSYYFDHFHKNTLFNEK